ncbi:hypothetical protein GCM10010172_37360 [Paractinoplanes ferrugineus]|uniref:Flagellar basal body-associated protein FliL n=1 Tax=Paractinoplanes ferrugineus TaxID=113564 RepID=A0A919MB40_9ACTN|nr:hypothetical protein [Actinoplanes ferrugineus]GIE09333.1 hypothetical protein Afe05nite_11730 [Actinoplanes ferrugineus]
MSQPPYSGQPYNGQPTSGQPYQGGQQYPGQPQSGQPYQGGQPQYGQPNPDVPTSVPPQPPYPPTQAYPSSGQPDYGQQPPQYGQPQPPAYGPGDYGQQPPQSGQPQFGQPQSGQPQFGQPQYGQPQYGQPEFAQPGFPQGTPPKKKSKALPIILVSVAIVLVLCIGGVVALVMVGKDKADDINNQLADSTAKPTATATAEAADPTEQPTTTASNIKIVEPATLGGRPKLTDPQFASVAKELKDGLASVPSATNTVGSLYGTVAKQDIVIVVAAEAPIANPEKELDQTFMGAGVGGLKISNITDAPTGSLGGTAKCGSAETSGIDMAICSWADDGSLGMVMWYFKSVTKAKAEFPKLRAQIEKKS